MAEVYRCPNCHAEYPKRFLICAECGLNILSGEVPEPEDDEDAIDVPRSRRFAAWVAEYLPGFFRPSILIASIVLSIIGIGVAIFAVALVFVGVLLGSIGAAALGGLAYAQAIAWMLTGRFDNLLDCLVDFDSTHWTIFSILLMTPGSVLIIAAAQGAG